MRERPQAVAVSPRVDLQTGAGELAMVARLDAAGVLAVGKALNALGDGEKIGADIDADALGHRGRSEGEREAVGGPRGASCGLVLRDGGLGGNDHATLVAVVGERVMDAPRPG